jgi:hypothetical protein
MTTNTHLSTGRKRLALVVSYLEDEPVYVFDEVAADQDPHFRRYFHVGDRVLQMDYGKLRDLPRDDVTRRPRKGPARRSKQEPTTAVASNRHPRSLTNDDHPGRSGMPVRVQ